MTELIRSLLNYYARKNKRLNLRLNNGQRHMDSVEAYKLRKAIRNNDRKVKELQGSVLPNFDGSCIIKSGRTDSPDEDVTWITTETGSHVPLNKNGVAVGGALKGKSFSKAKSQKSSEPQGKSGSDKPKSSAKGESKPNVNRPKSGTMAEKDHVLTGRSEQAQKAYDKARAAEPRITDDLYSIAKDIGCEMDGLDFSVKTASSVSGKIERMHEKMPEKAEDEIVREMGDLVRYTNVCEHDSIVETTEKSIAELTKKGYNIIELDNKYTGEKAKDYKGVHIEGVSPDGQKFELQIHSQLSLKIKNENHVMYEESRKVGTSEERVSELKQLMQANTAKIPMPKGIESLKGFKKPAQ